MANSPDGWVAPPPQEPGPAPLRLAVIAHIRHEHTRYDELLLCHGDRQPARAEVREQIDEILARWQAAEQL